MMGEMGSVAKSNTLCKRTALPLGLILKVLKKGAFVVLIATLLVAGSGCVKSSVVPGYHHYSFVTKYDKTFEKFVRKAEYSYGPYKWRNVNGNGGFGGLMQFYNLNVRWESVDGVKHEAYIPVPELMASLETEDHWGGGSGVVYPEPQLKLSIVNGNNVKLTYIIGVMVDEGPSPEGRRYVSGRDITYTIFSRVYANSQGGE